MASKGKKKKGFLKRLLGKAGTGIADDARESVDEEAKAAEAAQTPDVTVETPEETPPVAETPPPPKPETPPEPETDPAGQTPPPQDEAPDAEEAAPEAPAEEGEKRRGLFGRLKQRLGKTKSGLIDRVKQVITLHGKIDDDLIEEIEMILVQADVGIETTTKIIKNMRRNSEARKADGAEEVLRCFKDAIAEIVTHDERFLQLQPEGPTVILVIGVNGTGKTTTIGKLAKEFRGQGKSVLLVAADTFRAAAVEQLGIWADRTGSSIVKADMGADPAAVCYDALSAGNARGHDVVLIDTAGRLHTKSNLMEELKKIHRVIEKIMPGAPHETLLVLDATTGQNALSQAKLFGEAVEVTGLVMTKLDGTAKGGILIALRDLHEHTPVLKIGIGEDENDLRDFDPQAYVEALFAS